MSQLLLLSTPWAAPALTTYPGTDFTDDSLVVTTDDIDLSTIDIAGDTVEIAVPEDPDDNSAVQSYAQILYADPESLLPTVIEEEPLFEARLFPSEPNPLIPEDDATLDFGIIDPSALVIPTMLTEAESQSAFLLASYLARELKPQESAIQGTANVIDLVQKDLDRWVPRFRSSIEQFPNETLDRYLAGEMEAEELASFEQARTNKNARGAVLRIRIDEQEHDRTPAAVYHYSSGAMDPGEKEEMAAKIQVNRSFMFLTALASAHSIIQSEQSDAREAARQAAKPKTPQGWIELLGQDFTKAEDMGSRDFMARVLGLGIDPQAAHNFFGNNNSDWKLTASQVHGYFSDNLTGDLKAEFDRLPVPEVKVRFQPLPPASPASAFDPIVEIVNNCDEVIPILQFVELVASLPLDTDFEMRQTDLDPENRHNVEAEAFVYLQELGNPSHISGLQVLGFIYEQEVFLHEGGYQNFIGAVDPNILWEYRFRADLKASGPIVSAETLAKLRALSSKLPDPETILPHAKAVEILQLAGIADDKIEHHLPDYGEGHGITYGAFVELLETILSAPPQEVTAESAINELAAIVNGGDEEVSVKRFFELVDTLPLDPHIVARNADLEPDKRYSVKKAAQGYYISLGFPTHISGFKILKFIFKQEIKLHADAFETFYFQIDEKIMGEFHAQGDLTEIEASFVTATESFTAADLPKPGAEITRDQAVTLLRKAGVPEDKIAQLFPDYGVDQAIDYDAFIELITDYLAKEDS